MSARIAWLVAATTSGVILAFVVPLCLLVQELAHDRAMASAEQEARNVAILVSQLHGADNLPALVAELDERSPASTSVLTPDGAAMGDPDADVAADPDALRAERERRAFTVTSSSGGHVLVPVVTGSGTYVVSTWVAAAELHRGVRSAWLSIGALGAGLIVLAVAIAIRLGRRVSTPVTELAGAARQMGSGDLATRAAVAGPPEVAALAQALNGLAERVSVLLEAERARVGDLSHRLRTPVTALRLDVAAVHDPALEERLDEHVNQLQRTIDSIVHDARRPLGESLGASSDLTATVRNRLRFWSALAEDQGRRVTVVVPSEPLVVAVEHTALADVVDVLVDNVFAHTDDDVAFRVVLTPSGEGALLEVTDEGPGLAADAPGGRRQGSTGLGLKIARRTVVAAGGELSVHSDVRGTTVEVWLPLEPGR
jgi:signal transduction histidine kinase